MSLLMEPPRKTFAHIPVLCREVVAALEPAAEGWVVDATLGLGGHSTGLLERYPHMSVLGIEWDRAAAELAREKLNSFGSRFRAVEGTYADLPAILEQQGLGPVSGILLDLGVSSLQLDDATRGFSFSQRGPLDMRMSISLTQTAWDLLVHWDESELARIFKTYGEEPYARVVAKTLKEAIGRGQLSNDSWQVAQCIRGALPMGRGRIDPATRCFQALRMAVNHELDNIQIFLDTLPSTLRTGGRIVVLAFHSLEDRLIKHTFAQAARGCVCPPQAPLCVCGIKPWAKLALRKAIQASPQDILANPRSRSVRMRVLEKI